MARFINLENNKTMVETSCPCCGKRQSFIAPTDGLEKWSNGMCIQDAMPSVSPADRELLITGICDDCFNSFIDEDDE